MTSLTTLIGNIVRLIINPLIVLGFVVATIVFFYGIVQLIRGADSSDLEQRKRNVVYGLVGLFVMFSVYGILRLVLNTFGIEWPSFFE
jgi:uncharacterized protein with PQ loop repeat